MENVESILQNAGSQESISHNGDEIVGLPQNQGLTTPVMLAMLFMFLCFMVLMSLRRPNRENVGKPSPIEPDQNQGPPAPPID